MVVQPIAPGAALTVAGGPGDQDLPVWSPDGTRIVFQDSTAGGLSLVLPAGVWRCELRAGGRLVAVASVRLRR